MIDLKQIANLGFGGAALTNIGSYNNIKEILATAYDCGIRHYDTAPLYGKGYSEIIYGKFLKGKRKDITITTKFGLGEDYETGNIPVQLLLRLNQLAKKLKKKPGMDIQGNQLPVYNTAFKRIDKDLIEKSFTKSIKRLKTDYIDYYLLHEGLPSFLTDEAIIFISKLKQEGAVRFLGIGSNSSLISTLNSNDLQQWDVLQYEGGQTETVAEIMNKFPDKIHFHHSCLKGVRKPGFENDHPRESAGYLLAQAVSVNPLGKVIFSTQKKEHLKKNIQEFLKYRSV
jgi:aryl-alcohol dehydrogenase-like predicted oxidoreductase